MTSKDFRVGIHVGSGKSLIAAAQDYVERCGIECLQIFSGNPNGWVNKPIDTQIAEEYKQWRQRNDIGPLVIHTCYLINMAGPKPDFREKSLANLVDQMNRAYLMGAEFVVTHVGSHMGEGQEKGIARVCEMAEAVLEASPEGPVFLFEGASGQGNHIGNTFEDLAAIMQGLVKYRGRLGICLDSAHVFAAGYDISSESAVKKTLDAFDEIVGLEHLKVWHANDTEQGLGSKKDRHAHVAKGNVGEAGFIALMQRLGPLGIPFIAETPVKSPEDEIMNVNKLKELRSRAG
jgi:deoxyribonuclease-4